MRGKLEREPTNGAFNFRRKGALKRKNANKRNEKEIEKRRLEKLHRRGTSN